MKIFQLTIKFTLAFLSILNFGIAEACTLPNVSTLNIGNQVSKTSSNTERPLPLPLTIKVHLDESCSCNTNMPNGTKEQIIQWGSDTGKMSISSDIEGSCRTCLSSSPLQSAMASDCTSTTLTYHLYVVDKDGNYPNETATLVLKKDNYSAPMKISSFVSNDPNYKVGQSSQNTSTSFYVAVCNKDATTCP